MIRRFSAKTVSTSKVGGEVLSAAAVMNSSSRTGWFSGLFGGGQTSSAAPKREQQQSASNFESQMYARQSSPPPGAAGTSSSSTSPYGVEQEHPQKKSAAPAGFFDGPDDGADRPTQPPQRNVGGRGRGAGSPHPPRGGPATAAPGAAAPGAAAAGGGEQPPEPPTAHALCAAAVEGDLDRVQELMSRGAPPNMAPSAAGLTALHAAAMSGKAEVVDYMINHSGPRAPSPMLVVTKERITPLHVACAHNQLEVVKLLCAKVHELGLPDFKDPDDKTVHSAVDVRAQQERVTALHLAVKFASPAVVEELLKTGADPTLFTSEPEPQSPVSVACLRGDLPLLKLLFMYGIKLEGMSERQLVELAAPGSGTTPLQIAAGAGQTEIVRFLVEECDADPRRCGGVRKEDKQQQEEAEKEGSSSAFANKNNDDDAELCPHPPLYLAAYGGYVETARYLIEHSKIHPDEQLIGDGASALHAACRSGNVDTVKLLLEHGADRMRRRTDTDMVPAHVASMHGHLGVLKVLLPPATPLPPLPLVDKKGFTCLHFALIGGPHVQCIEYLLSVGFESEIFVRADERRLTPLHFAAEAGSAKALQTMLSRVTDDVRRYELVNMKDASGLTALHAAAHSGSIEAVQVLLDAGADMAIADRMGQTPMLIAKNAQHPKLVEFMQQRALATTGTVPGAP